MNQGSVCEPDTLLYAVAKEKTKFYNREKDLTINVQPAKVNFSESNFKIVAREIIDNAIKYSNQGSMIHVVGISLNNEYIISIMDTGRGMTEEQISSIGDFMQFERKHFEQQGTGLGLSIAKKLVELHGGKLKIESIPTRQTIVRITLNRVRNQG